MGSLPTDFASAANGGVGDKKRWRAVNANETNGKVNELEDRLDAAVGGSGGGGGGQSSYPPITVNEYKGYTEPAFTITFPGTSASVPSGFQTVMELGTTMGKRGLVGTKAVDLVDVSSLYSLPTNSYFGSNWRCFQDGTSGVAQYPVNPFAVKRMVSGTRYVEWLVGTFSNFGGLTKPFVHIFVNGRRITQLPIDLVASGFSYATANQRIRLDFGSTFSEKPMEVEFWCNNLVISKMYIESDGSCWPSEARGPLAAYLGDSFGGYTVNTGIELGSWFPQWAKMSGYRDIYNGTVPGSGVIVAPGSYTNYQARALTDINPLNPNVVMVGTITNDIGSGKTPAECAAGLATTINNLGLASSNPQVIAFTLYDPLGVNGAAGGSGYTYAQFADALVPVTKNADAALVVPTSGKVYGFGQDSPLMEIGPFMTTVNKTRLGMGIDGLHGNDVLHEEFATYMRECTRGLANVA